MPEKPRGERFERLAQIVVEASELSPAERSAYLDSACSGDPSLRREAEAKLAYLDSESPMLRTHGVHRHLGVDVPPDRESPRDSQSLSNAGSPSNPPAGAHLESVGPFRVLRVLGSGGMGIVYEAEQAEPIQRRVAIKLIKAGMDSEEVIARFATERQALAVMDHPSIARVLDAGMTETGRPYFVMELVDGIPITDYCEERGLSIRSRLALMIAVCQAVQHAHQKGVLHRDLKPSNVLITQVDGQPVPKVIDFGIAKATGSGSSLGGDHTVQGQVIGTPEYMSPEQALGGERSVDTRTDVYSLGVLLYELLTDQLPFDSDTLRERSLVEIQRILTDTEPARPSTRVDPSLRRQLRGDLDWIVLCAMEKDPARRYESAAALARDIERALHDEAIEARPPSTTYRLRKAVRRHRLAFGFVATVAVLLLGFGVWMSVLYRRAEGNLARAVAAERAAAQESRTAKEVSAFLTDLFEVSDPGEARGNSVTAREILDRGAAKIDAELAGEPLVQATMKATIGEVYGKLGLFDQAEPLLRDALDTQASQSRVDSLGLARAQFDLGALYSTTGRFEDARALLSSAIAIRKRQLGGADPKVGQAVHALAMLRWNLGEMAEAEVMLTDLIETREALPEGQDADLAEYVDALAVCVATQGRIDESEPYFERALELRESLLGPDHPDVALSYSNLGMLYREQKRLEESTEMMRKSLTIRETVLGPDHIDVAASLNNLGIVLDNQGLHTEAEPHLLRALDIRERALGPDHPLIGESLVNLAFCRSRLGRPEESLSGYKRALDVYEGAFGESRPEVGLVLNDISYILEQMGRYRDALPYRKRTVQAQAKGFGADSPKLSNALMNLARLQARLGNTAEARPLLERALSIREAAFGTNSEGANEVRRELKALGRD